MINKNTTSPASALRALRGAYPERNALEMGWQERADAARNRREFEHRSAGKALGLVRI